MAKLEITVKGRSAVVRRPEFGDLVAYETARRQGDDFAAKVTLYKRISEQTGEPLPKALQVSVAAAALRHAGDEMAVVQLEEDELEGEAAKQYAEALEKCSPVAYRVGEIQVVCREPASDVLQVYYKTSDASIMNASRALAVWCFSAMGKAGADAAAKKLDERYPAAYVGLANALADLGGLTAQAEVREL